MFFKDNVDQINKVISRKKKDQMLQEGEEDNSKTEDKKIKKPNNF